MLVQRELGRVEEEDLANLRLQGVEAERAGGRELGGLGNRQLQLDGVHVLDQAEDLLEFFIGPGGLRGGRRSHLALLSRVISARSAFQRRVTSPEADEGSLQEASSRLRSRFQARR